MFTLIRKPLSPITQSKSPSELTRDCLQSQKLRAKHDTGALSRQISPLLKKKDSHQTPAQSILLKV